MGVQDAMVNSNNIEEFLAKSYSRHPYSTHYEGQQPWDQQVNLPVWLTKLVITPVDRSVIQQIISDALRLSEGAEDPNVGEAFRSRLCAIKLPAQGWSITEIAPRRNPVGATDTIVLHAGKDYLFLETHLES